MFEWIDAAWSWLWAYLFDIARESTWALAVAAWALLRATGVTVDSGQTGLLYSFGRARTVVGPGFRFLIPFLQVVKILPTRDRTLNLPAQRVTTREGLVFLVDANLLYRVVDVKRALIEIDDVVRGMSQALGLGVQSVLRERVRADIRAGPALDAALAEDLGLRLEAWGVEVVRAGFITITPSAESLRVTQLGAKVAARADALAAFEEAGLSRHRALALLGTRARLLTRVRACRDREHETLARKRIERRFLQAEFPILPLRKAFAAPNRSTSRKPRKRKARQP